jgi:outer membrane biosynthesis protein TonB
LEKTMREKEPQFTVTDRRKFTAEGELREGEGKAVESSPPPPAIEREQKAASPQPAAPAPAAPALQVDLDEPEMADGEETIPEPTAQESAQQSKEYHASASRLDEMLSKANPGQPAPAVMNFDRLVQSLYMTAAVQMGAGTAPNEQPRIDILGARQSIDMLSVLDEKTNGNLTEQEKRLLQNALFDLRMSFLEITNAIASSAAQRAPQPKRPH